MEDNHSKKIWWIVLTVITLLVAAFWVFYWRNISFENTGFPFAGSSQKSELLSIESEINAMDVSNLDADLVVLEKEINQ